MGVGFIVSLFALIVEENSSGRVCAEGDSLSNRS